jgi:hypothetical protein
MNLELSLDSIETAHRFVALLCDAVVDSKRDIEGDVKREADPNFPRRRDALQIILTKLETLQVLLTHSRRTLNDLRSLRRVMFEERGTVRATPVQPAAKAIEAQPAPVPKPKPVAVADKVMESPPAPKSRPVVAANKKRAISARVEAKPKSGDVAEIKPWYYRPGVHAGVALKRTA